MNTTTITTTNINIMSVEDITKFINKAAKGVINPVEWLVTQQPLPNVVFSYNEKALTYNINTYNSVVLIDYTFNTGVGTFSATYNLGSLDNNAIAERNRCKKKVTTVKHTKQSYDLTKIVGLKNIAVVLHMCCAHKEFITSKKLLRLVENWAKVCEPTNCLVTKKLNEIVRYETAMCIEYVSDTYYYGLASAIKALGTEKTIAYCIVYKYLNGKFPEWVTKSFAMNYSEYINNEKISASIFVKAYNLLYV